MVFMIIIPFLNGYNWEYTLFSDKPIWGYKAYPTGVGPLVPEFFRTIRPEPLTSLKVNTMVFHSQVQPIPWVFFCIHSWQILHLWLAKPWFVHSGFHSYWFMYYPLDSYDHYILYIFIKYFHILSLHIQFRWLAGESIQFSSINISSGSACASWECRGSNLGTAAQSFWWLALHKATQNFRNSDKKNMDLK